MRILPVLLVLCLPTLAAADKFALKDGDRVVLLGNALVEREQLSGWWELALTTRFHGKKIVFRNLGWSGDDVYGTSRAGFGDANLGFKELKDHTLALKPTVLVIGYGNVEAFDGPAGKEKFRKGLERLLDTLAPTKAKVVLLSPVVPAKLGKPFPDPTKQSENVRLYAQVVSEVAAKRGHHYADLTGLLSDPGKGADAKTLDGITLTAAGYRETASAFEKALGLTDEPVRAEESARLEKLRKLIVAKNELYFHRWRPQNVTYLLGFRKHEQGNNAREIPQFDPLIEAKEKEIAAFAAPVKVKFELKRK